MNHIISTPSYHHISPLTRSRSRSEIRAAPTGHFRTRSHSFTAPNSGGGFTMPSYGYGGGFMARSLSRSNSTLSLFGRSLHSTALDKTPPFHNVAVQRSTPHYSDKYPYVRYSYGNLDTGLTVRTQTEMNSTNYPGIKDAGTKRWLEGKLNTYNTGLFSRPVRNNYIERPVAPIRNYVKYMPVDDAVDMYKKKCMTVGTLSKYWLQSSNPTSRFRDKEYTYGRSSSISTLTGSYSSRYNPPVSATPSYRYSNRVSQPYYSKVASKLNGY
jgi:hypothetical protein